MSGKHIEHSDRMNIDSSNEYDSVQNSRKTQKEEGYQRMQVLEARVTTKQDRPEKDNSYKSLKKMPD